MRIILATALCALLFAGQACTRRPQEINKEKMSENEKMSYSFGYETGRSAKDNSVDIDPDMFAMAFKEGFAGKQAVLSDQEMREARLPIEREMAAARAEQTRQANLALMKVAQEQKTAGEAFLAENSKKEGVVTLPSGLQYKVIKKGLGRKPLETDKVKIHYRGGFINGSEFVNSYKSEKPATISVDKVISGWSEALQLMREGSKWQLFIPADLAYGKSGAKRNGKIMIPPYASIICDLELISIVADTADTEDVLRPAKSH